MAVSVEDKFLKTKKGKSTPLASHKNEDPYKVIELGKFALKSLTKEVHNDHKLAYAQIITYKVIESYWKYIHQGTTTLRTIPNLELRFVIDEVNDPVSSIADSIGKAAASLGVIEASYLLGNVYTSMLPENIRAAHGIFYTPPSLTSRLIKMANDAGVDWKTARVIDPACGGGAFLAPICLKKVEALKHLSSSEIITHLGTHVVGLEIDSFGAWLTQVFVEVSLRDLIKNAEINFPSLVRVCNSLENSELYEERQKFDLVIGNPPYGKIKLTENIRERFKDSLYGHPNLYGLFTHLSLDICNASGLIALVTPTSFLSGEYFKKLRYFIRKNSRPVEIDFVTVRKGVFEDVLQETMLAIYRREANEQSSVKVNQITTLPHGGLELLKVGTYILPHDLTLPWILPRSYAQSAYVTSMQAMPCRLSDWGYKISTGPLVWNRHKEQLSVQNTDHSYPIIWSESITQNGEFILRSDKKNHKPWFHANPGNDWLITTRQCILLQRTTAKEQDKRLIAAALPQEVLSNHNGVVIENHLNMIIPITDTPKVSVPVLAAFLNSKTLNDAFRTISGSVAVSAYELESLPLPSPNKLKNLSKLVANSSPLSQIEAACKKIFLNNE
jgi:adenine-specific DNA-methyltransferase